MPAVDLFRYDVYRGTPRAARTGGLAEPGTTAFTDTGLSPGTRYYYVVRAVDQSANQSDASNEVRTQFR